MSNTGIEQMKKIIEDKKKKSSQQNLMNSTKNDQKIKSNNGFKSTKKSGSLNK
ncbi:MAG TPA: hypothetical protein GXZ90_02030 [Clostridiales bacterium]|nr:hypothetical protein [Clostridiales bacterium]